MIDHNLRRLNGTLGDLGNCGVEDCQRCAEMDREHERRVRHRNGVEKVLRERLGDRMFETLHDKGYITLYGGY